MVRKPLAPKPPKLAVVKDDKPKQAHVQRPHTNVISLAAAVQQGAVEIRDMTPVEGEAGVVDIAWQGRVDGKTVSATLRTSQHAAQQRGLAA